MKVSKNKFFSMLERGKVSNFTYNSVRYYAQSNYNADKIDEIIDKTLEKLNKKPDRKRRTDLLLMLSILGIMKARRTTDIQNNPAYGIPQAIFDSIKRKIQEELKPMKSSMEMVDPKRAKVDDSVIMMVPDTSRADIRLLDNHASEVLDRVHNEKEFNENSILSDYVKFYKRGTYYYVFYISDKQDLDVFRTTIMNKLSKDVKYLIV